MLPHEVNPQAQEPRVSYASPNNSFLACTTSRRFGERDPALRRAAVLIGNAGGRVKRPTRQAVTSTARAAERRGAPHTIERSRGRVSELLGIESAPCQPVPPDAARAAGGHWPLPLSPTDGNWLRGCAGRGQRTHSLESSLPAAVPPALSLRCERSAVRPDRAFSCSPSSCRSSSTCSKRHCEP